MGVRAAAPRVGQVYLPMSTSADLHSASCSHYAASRISVRSKQRSPHGRHRLTAVVLVRRHKCLVGEARRGGGLVEALPDGQAGVGIRDLPP